MNDRISLRRSHPTPGNRSSVRLPADSQAASEFQSLLNGDQDRAQEPVAEQRPLEGQKKERSSRQDKQQEKGGDGGDQGGSSDLRMPPEAGENAPPPVALPSPEDILSNLTAASSPPPRAEATDELSAVVHQVADEVLVTDLSGQREVRITLKDAVLADTQVRLSVDQGRLQVRLVTGSAESHQKISAFQGSLQTILSERLSGQEVRVSVESETNMGGDAQGQSRGRSDHPHDDETDEPQSDRNLSV